MFSIRNRMLINVVALAVPLCLFAWLLMQEVQKQIDFAEQELKGIALQVPLTNLSHDIQARRMALLRNEDLAAIDARLKQRRAELSSVYAEVGSAIGFTSQALSESNITQIGLPLATKQWDAVAASVNTALEQLPATADTEGLAAHTTLAGAVKAMITRASDGSNLTLDPDLDSYYVMDALSFAIPNSIENLANAESDLLAMLPNRSSAAENIAKIEVWKHIISGDDTARVMGSLGTALAEDANFYGESASLARLKPLMSAHEEQTRELMAELDRARAAGGAVQAVELSHVFDATRATLMSLHEAAQAEMKILLNQRIHFFAEHLKSLMIEGGAALLAGLVIFWLVSRSIVNPINRLRDVMDQLAKGKLGVDVPYLAKRDEIGQMAAAVIVFKQNAQHLRKLATDFEASVKHVVEIVAAAAVEMNATSRDVGDRSSASHQRLTALNTDVTDVSQSIQHVAAAGSQLSKAISEISAQVYKSTATTNAAVTEAGNVKRVAKIMADSAQKVSGIVEIINGIAAKITLLSLNATIEAARAGEAGKGFAVVVSEVKTLATQTANATSEIAGLVDAMQGSSRETLGAISQISSVIEQINQISSIIAAAIEEQGAATKEISGHIDQASGRVGTIIESIGTVADSTGHSSAAATQAVQASEELSQQADKLRSEVNKFLQNLHAA
jgi:methyl-accepting chemotaxis protein